MDIARTEIFGPVLSIIPFHSEEEAITIANDTPYGLTNYIQSQDQEKVKSEIESHKSNYENLVDKATLEIESFIKKHEVDTKAQ